MTAHKPSSEQSDSSDDSEDDWFNPTFSYRKAPTKHNPPGYGGSAGPDPRAYDPDRESQWDDEEVRSLDDIPEEHLPDVPDDPDWAEYVSYRCRNPECQDQCINRMDGPYAVAKLCRACFSDHDLEEMNSSTHHLPPEYRRPLSEVQDSRADPRSKP